MEHVTIEFNHGIQDLIPFTDFIMKLKSELQENHLGEYLGDDMAIDGGDAEVFFSCSSAKDLFEFIQKNLTSLSFMKNAKVTFTFGELEAGASEETFLI